MSHLVADIECVQFVFEDPKLVLFVQQETGLQISESEVDSEILVVRLEGSKVGVSFEMPVDYSNLSSPNDFGIMTGTILTGANLDRWLRI